MLQRNSLSLFERFCQAVDKNDYLVAKKLIKQIRPEELEKLPETYGGCRPLFYAVINSDAAMIKLLLQHGANPSHPIEDAGSFLHYVIAKCTNEKSKYLELIKAILDCENTYLDLQDEQNVSPLLLACKNNEIEIVDMLLQHGASPFIDEANQLSPEITAILLNYKNKYQNSSDLFLFERFTRAVKDDQYEIAVKLITQLNPGNPPKAYKGCRPLFYAVLNRNAEMIKLLLQHGDDPNQSVFLTASFLHYIIAKSDGDESRCIKLITAFLECAKTDVDLKDKDISPLLLACQKDKVKIVEVLLQHGASPFVDNAKLFSPEIEKLLLTYKAKYQHSHELFLFERFTKAVDDNQYQIAAELITQLHPEKLPETFTKCRPFLYAVFNRNVEMIKLLLMHGANPNQSIIEAGSFLHYVITDYVDNENTYSESKCLELMAAALSCQDIDIDLKDRLDLSPLLLACQKGKVKIVEVLLQHGASPFIDDAKLFSPEIEKLLLTYKTKYQNSAEYFLFERFTQAVDDNQYQIAARLVTQLHPEKPPEKFTKCRPFFYAVLNRNTDMIKLLLKYNADPNQLIMTEPLLHYVITNYDEKTCLESMAAILTCKFTIVDLKNDQGVSPLLLACQKNKIQIVEMLLKHGSMPFIGDTNKFSPEIKKLLSIYQKNYEPIPSVNNTFYNKNTIYTQKVIIDFAQDRGAEALAYKWDMRHLNKCTLLNVKDFFAGTNLPKFKDNDIVKIVIDAHGDRGLDHILSGSKKSTDRIYYSDLAEKLKPLIVGNHKVVINLTVCSGGRGSIDNLKDDTGATSVAAKLQAELSLINPNVVVVARLSTVRIITKNKHITCGAKNTDQLGATNKATKCSKQAGSKVAYLNMYDVNNKEIKQYKIDAYFYFEKLGEWKSRAKNILTTIIVNTPVGGKKQLLESWRSDLDTKELALLLNEMKYEVTSGIFKTSNQSPSLFSVPSSNHNISSLVDSGKKILSFLSPYTLLKPVETGMIVMRKKN